MNEITMTITTLKRKSAVCTVYPDRLERLPMGNIKRTQNPTLQ